MLTTTEAIGQDVRLTLTIGVHGYDVRPVAPAPQASAAFRLEAMSTGKVYDVDQFADGSTCTCGDFVHRRAGNDSLGCKHIRALRQMGMVAPRPEPVPAVEPEPAPVVEEQEWDDDHVWTEGPADDADDATDDYRWTVTEAAAPTKVYLALPAPAPVPAAVLEPDPTPPTLAEELGMRIAKIRLEGTPLAELMAEHLEKLLAEVQATDATDVGTFRDRRDALANPAPKPPRKAKSPPTPKGPPAADNKLAAALAAMSKALSGDA